MFKYKIEKLKFSGGSQIDIEPNSLTVERAVNVYHLRRIKVSIAIFIAKPFIAKFETIF